MDFVRFHRQFMYGNISISESRRVSMFDFQQFSRIELEKERGMILIWQRNYIDMVAKKVANLN
jgi:hypothetical protein